MSLKVKKSAPVVRTPRKKKVNGYRLPEPIPNGEILRDIAKKNWRIGPSIGLGGFGEIYCASDDINSVVGSKAPYVIKIEPHENGPLFVEMHFYMRVAKQEDIQNWMQKKSVSSLGMPRYISSGSHECNGQKYRFLVMDRFGKDLWTIFLENKRIFPQSTVLHLGIQIIDILEYIHSKEYVHADIKGSNLLLGFQKGTENQVYLVDYGLACHYLTKEYKFDPKKAHNGTIEYTSRDAHMGVFTRRGDLEILGYNMLQWLCSRLPWEDKLTDPEYVSSQKKMYMADIPLFMKKCFGKKTVPVVLEKYLKYIANLNHDTEPDYNHCRKILKDGLKACGGTVNGKLEFGSSARTSSPKKQVRSRTEKEVKPRKRRGDENHKQEDESSDTDFCTTPQKNKKVGAVSKAKSRKIDDAVDEKSANKPIPSWKNCPTIIASNIVRPGVYQRSGANSAASLKKTKKTE